MGDKELLELAAKAAGIGPVLCYEARRNLLRIGTRESYSLWRPLTDDGDALRLAVKLGLRVEHAREYAVAYSGSVMAEQFSERNGSDPYAATRRAIVRAAAAIATQEGE